MTGPGRVVADSLHRQLEEFLAEPSWAKLRRLEGELAEMLGEHDADAHWGGLGRKPEPRALCELCGGKGRYGWGGGVICHACDGMGYRKASGSSQDARTAPIPVLEVSDTGQEPEAAGGHFAADYGPSKGFGLDRVYYGLQQSRVWKVFRRPRKGDR